MSNGASGDPVRSPQFNFKPGHAVAAEMPEEMRRQAAEAFERAMSRLYG